LPLPSVVTEDVDGLVEIIAPAIGLLLDFSETHPVILVSTGVLSTGFYLQENEIMKRSKR